MQTFITDFDLEKSAKNLDYKRLGKQRVETIQIANECLGLKNGWQNHPAIKMWKGYEKYLILEYLYLHLLEWQNRGYKSPKCLEHYERLKKNVKNLNFIKPFWITEEFIESHRSNLIAKKYEHYKPLFPNTKEGLSYIWPVI
jgi:hypothetical protein